MIVFFCLRPSLLVGLSVFRCFMDSLFLFLLFLALCLFFKIKTFLCVFCLISPLCLIPRMDPVPVLQNQIQLRDKTISPFLRKWEQKDWGGGGDIDWNRVKLAKNHFIATRNNPQVLCILYISDYFMHSSPINLIILLNRIWCTQFNRHPVLCVQDV